jgi:CPA2 family monovalent cation:H+ antiporter-2
MELEYLKALVLVFGVSALTVYALHGLRMPTIVGFITAGVLIGPHGTGIIKDIREIEALAEIGVILLLFTVGLEFSLKKLLKMRKVLVIGGGGQVVLCIVAAAAITYPFTGNLGSSVFFGFLFALSSTAVVLKMLLERGEIDSPQGRTMAGMLIFQDLCVIPFMMLLPVLSGELLEPARLVLALFEAALLMVVVLVSAKWLVPIILHRVVHTKSRELFIITIMFLCLGIALLSSELGLSLALGAFIAGLVLSESEYAYQATADMLPFKESFMGLFFVSTGMLVDTTYVLSHWPVVLAAVLGIFFVKSLVSMFSLLFVSTSARIALHAALGVAQIGEFSFILAAAGKAAGIMTGETFQLFLSAAIVTMAMTPFVLGWSPSISTWLMSRKSVRRLDKMVEAADEVLSTEVSDHVIIVGFGLNGKNLAYTLRETGLPYVVLDLNINTVREEKKKGQPIYFGDGTSIQVLKKLGLNRARFLVVAILDPAGTRKIVTAARKETSAVHIIVRTRYLKETVDLMQIGADDVIPEEFETSIEIFSRVLHNYNIPRNVINDRIDNIRRNSYMAFRSYVLPKRTLGLAKELLRDMETASYLVKKDSPIVSYSLSKLGLRSKTGATVIAVQRKLDIHQNPGAGFTFRENDVMLLVGSKEQINRAIEHMDSEIPPLPDSHSMR